MKQPRTDARFKLGNRRRHRRARQSQRVGGAGKARAFHHPRENPKQINAIHGAPLVENPDK
jgi:hypothetical protein